MSSIARQVPDLKKRMSLLGVRQEDIRESFIRSSGPGGQNVNKTATCVYLKHLPTGIEVKCGLQRYQMVNRHLAMHILLNKLENAAMEKRLREQSIKAKIIRQRRARPKKVKLLVLEHKRRHSEKKSLRRKIREIEIA